MILVSKVELSKEVLGEADTPHKYFQSNINFRKWQK